MVSKGEAFYNANKFTILHFVLEFEPKGDLRALIKDIGYRINAKSGKNKIVIASTPDHVSPEYMATLDGGILHEAFHTFYSLRDPLDEEKAFDAISPFYDPTLPYKDQRPLLKDVWNTFEDSYIERKGMKDFKGAMGLLQKVHEMVWGLEEEVRGKSELSDVMMALRDRIEPYLKNPPSYSEETNDILDTHFKDIIQRGKTTEDPYEVLSLTFETWAKLIRLNLKKEDKGERKNSDGGTILNGEGTDDNAKEGNSILLDISDAINQMYTDEVTDVDLPHAMPYTREHDDVVMVPSADAKAVSAFKDLAARARRDSLYIRPRTVALLRGVRKIKRSHHQKKGRLSARNLAEVVYKEDPRPFMSLTAKETESAAVSVVLDESGSMNPDLARYILTVFAVTFQDLKIPFEVIGFQDFGWDSNHPIPEEEISNRFTRYTPRTFNVFRTFDENFNDVVLAKLMQTRASGITPILDGLDFAGRRLLVRPEEKKLLILITDGEMTRDSRSPVTSRDLINIANREIDLLEAQGVDSLIVGIGRSGRVSDYKKSVAIPDTTKFSDIINRCLEERLKS